MEMYQIRYVLAAADHLNFTRAAVSCDVSQPALTKGIKALETELAAPLFHREGRRIVLSQLGRSMLPHLRQIAAEAEAARTLAQEFNRPSKVPVRLGVQSTVGPSCFAPFLDALGRTHPGLDLGLSMGSTPALAHALQMDELDLAVLTRLPELECKLTLLPLYRDRYAVILPPGHPLSARESVVLRDLAGESLVDRPDCEMRGPLRAAFEAAGVPFEARFRAERDDWVQGMVLAGLGIAILPGRSVSEPGLEVRPLAHPVIEREVCLASVPERRLSPDAAATMRLAHSFAWPR